MLTISSFDSKINYSILFNQTFEGGIITNSLKDKQDITLNNDECNQEKIFENFTSFIDKVYPTNKNEALIDAKKILLFAINRYVSILINHRHKDEIINIEKDIITSSQHIESKDIYQIEKPKKELTKEIRIIRNIR